MYSTNSQYGKKVELRFVRSSNQNVAAICKISRLLVEHSQDSATKGCSIIGRNDWQRDKATDPTSRKAAADSTRTDPGPGL